MMVQWRQCPCLGAASDRGRIKRIFNHKCPHIHTDWISSGVQKSAKFVLMALILSACICVHLWLKLLACFAMQMVSARTAHLGCHIVTPPR